MHTLRLFADTQIEPLVYIFPGEGHKIQRSGILGKIPQVEPAHLHGRPRFFQGRGGTDS